MYRRIRIVKHYYHEKDSIRNTRYYGFCFHLFYSHYSTVYRIRAAELETSEIGANFGMQLNEEILKTLKLISEKKIISVIAPRGLLFDKNSNIY